MESARLSRLTYTVDTSRPKPQERPARARPPLEGAFAAMIAGHDSKREQAVSVADQVRERQRQDSQDHRGSASSVARPCDAPTRTCGMSTVPA